MMSTLLFYTRSQWATESGTVNQFTLPTPFGNVADTLYCNCSPINISVLSTVVFTEGACEKTVDVQKEKQMDIAVIYIAAFVVLLSIIKLSNYQINLISFNKKLL